jgi:hypothetical protein
VRVGAWEDELPNEGVRRRRTDIAGVLRGEEENE